MWAKKVSCKAAGDKKKKISDAKKQVSARRLLAEKPKCDGLHNVGKNINKMIVGLVRENRKAAAGYVCNLFLTAD